jgi:outer membrane protein assembly factor BamB
MKPKKAIKDYMHLLFVGCAACIAGMTHYSTVYGADWPNWRGPNHNGISDESGWMTTWPEEGPKVLWRASIGTGFSSMAVSKGRVYAMGNINDNDILYCFNADNGTEIWKQSYPCPLLSRQHEGGPSATPTVEGNAVYVASRNGDCLRIEAAAGQIVWHKNIVKELNLRQPRWYLAGSPFIAGDLVILNAGDRGVALKKSDGSVAWQNGNGIAGYTTAVPFTMGNQKCVVIVGAKEIAALDTATGKVLWSYPWETRYDINAADPIIVDGKLFVSSGYNKGCGLFRIGPDGLTEIWQNKNMRNHINSSVLWRGYIYGFDGQAGRGGKLVCINSETGQTKWSQGGMDTGSLMLADGKLIILSERGKLVIAEASPDGFKELASAQILTGKCWTVPVLANGRIYARNADGQLVCIDVRSKG